MAKKLTDEKPKSQLAPELYLEHRRAIARTAVALGEAQSAHQTAMKKAKAAGINTGDMQLWIKLQKADPEVREQTLRNLARFSAWEGTPLGTQGSLFGATDDMHPTERAQAEHREFRAEDDGYHCGRDSEPRENNPHQQGTPLFVKWDAGWLRGEEALKAAAAELGENDKKQQRGRRKKGGNPEDRPAA